MTAPNQPTASAPKNLPLCSLIICSRDRPQLLIDTVQSVLSGDWRPDELVVVDQSRTPNEALMKVDFSSRGCQLNYFWSGGKGLSRARNDGIAAARHDLLVFLDDDMQVASDWLRTAVSRQALDGPGVVLTGRVMAGEAEIAGAYVPSVQASMKAAVYRGRVNEEMLSAGNMSMFRPAVESVGPFDERLGAGTSFPSSEDNDFCLRLLEAGYAISYVPEMVVFHRAWRNDDLGIQWRYGVGQGAFYAKHFSLSDPYMLGRVCRDYVRRTWWILRYFLRGPRGALRDFAFLAGVSKGMLWWLLFAPAPAGRDGSQMAATVR